jgi:hypothetical protein
LKIAIVYSGCPLLRVGSCSYRTIQPTNDRMEDRVTMQLSSAEGIRISSSFQDTLQVAEEVWKWEQYGFEHKLVGPDLSWYLDMQ